MVRAIITIRTKKIIRIVRSWAVSRAG